MLEFSWQYLIQFALITFTLLSIICGIAHTAINAEWTRESTFLYILAIVLFSLFGGFVNG